MEARITVHEFFEAAALRAARIPFIESRLVSGRVVFDFADDGGRATEALKEHRSGTLTLPTISYAESLAATKTEIFAARRAGGLE